MSEAPAEQRVALADESNDKTNTSVRSRNPIALYLSRILALCVVELQHIRHDRTELYTRLVQPTLWLVLFGGTFAQLRNIPTGDVPYLAYITPGVITQSVLFISIFYGITLVWERDSGVLAKLLVTPTPRSAIVAGKAFAAGVRSITQAVAVLVIAFILGVRYNANVIEYLAALLIVVLSAVLFACVSMCLAGILLKRDRLMGIGQAISLPLFFASNALYPITLMPTWLQWVSRFNPLTYQVNALRHLLLNTPGNLALDFLVVGATALFGIIAASAAIGRLAR